MARPTVELSSLAVCRPARISCLPCGVVAQHWGRDLCSCRPRVLGFYLDVLVPPAGVPRWAVWLGFCLQVLLYALTAVYWGPLMARLSTPESGLSLPLYHTLMQTHWLRVAIVTAYGLLVFWMLTRSALWSATNPVESRARVT
jgi:hypothetical protein